jgi:hypothetical protein
MMSECLTFLISLFLGAALIQGLMNPSKAVHAQRVRQLLNRRARAASVFPNPLASSYYENCLIEQWQEQPIDHFNFRIQKGRTFRQRYFVCKKYFRGDGDPVFFYAGNEAAVTLYINATGFMWENAPRLNAMIIFAEVCETLFWNFPPQFLTLLNLSFYLMEIHT